jgi:hypothetical protein
MILNKKSLIVLFSIVSANLYADDFFTLPEYKVIDNNFVNMASGNVSHSFTDVSIGGSLGLTHTVSNAVHFNYFGMIKLVTSISEPTVMKVTGISNASFEINTDDTFEPQSDLSTSLEFIQGVGYIFTTQDGTEITYDTSVEITSVGQTAWMTKIVKPNGLTIKIAASNRPSNMGFGYMLNVSTNSGYQLKYKYSNSWPITDGEKSIVYSGVYWPQIAPKSVVGINSAVEYCTATTSTCSLTNNWPTTTYNWLNGQTSEDSIFTATDPLGRVLEYHFKAIDEAYTASNGHVIISPETYVVKLIEIKEFSSDDVSVTYDYAHDFLERTEAQMRNFQYRSQLRTAHRVGFSQTYDTNETNTQYHRMMHFSGGHKAIEHVYSDLTVGAPTEIQTVDKVINFEQSYTNKLTQIVDRFNGADQTFDYDSRGNLTHKHQFSDNRTSFVTTQASYPTTCANRKTCNRPTWTKDAKGNQTDYTYHTQSGQTATITQHANEDGKRRQVRYEYVEKFATYKINSSTPSVSPDGIWLLDRESYCINSNYVGSSCAGNDEVVTQYVYEPSNLQLIGVAVTAAGKTLRTCYRYDIYGNQIGETKPKANLSACSY